MKILFLAPRLPLPADTGGKIRTINILKQLTKFARVHLACFSFEADDGAWSQKLTSAGIPVSLVKLKEPKFNEKLTGVLFDQIPYTMAKYLSGSMRELLQKLATAEKFDAVHVDHLHMAHYREIFSGTPCVLDEHNVEYLITQRCAEVEKNPIKKKVYADQARKLKEFEAGKVQGFDRCLAVSEDDKKVLETISGGNVRCAVVPNGVDTDFFRASVIGESGSKEDCVVFTGSMDWWPNDDAVVYFAREILPLIWKDNSGMKFFIVGKSPTAAVKELAVRENRIIVTGRVDDVRPLMDKAKVFVVPIRVGGGTRLKILEAMSMGKPVVSTTLGAEGIASTDGHDIIIADEPAGFAAAVVALFANDERRDQIGQEARKLVCERYDWHFVGKKLESTYRELVRA